MLSIDFCQGFYSVEDIAIAAEATTIRRDNATEFADEAVCPEEAVVGEELAADVDHAFE